MQLKFINKYKDKLDNPVMIGYLIHLLTDRFYNNYFFKNHCLFNENDKPYSVKLKNGKIKTPIKKYKHSDFGKYDKWLLKHKFIEKFNDIKCLNNVIDLSVGNFDKNKLLDYIKKANKEFDNPKLYKINSRLFYTTLNKKELDNMFDNCCKYILEYINKLDR